MIKNRREAGKKLAEKLQEIVKKKKLIVLAIPRGGVIVGMEIAKMLDCKLDVIMSKKITPPEHPEYAIGAVTHDGLLYCGDDWKQYYQKQEFENEINKKKLEVKRRLENYRGNDQYQFNNKTVILVDDGIATGSTVFVLLKWLSKQEVKHIIIAIPVIPAHTYEEMKSLVDSIIALYIPTEFHAVGQFYQDFDQVSDEEVITILDRFKK